MTCLNLVCGVLACVAALSGDATMASVWIILAAVFDFLDGFVARALHAVSSIGKELDSLCDCVSFGVAPALMVWHMLEASPWRYAAILIAVCGAVRLARFNCDDTQTTSFVGLPIPANALFWTGASSLLSQWELDGDTCSVVLLVVLMSYLMVSPRRLFSLKIKSLAFKKAWHIYLLAVAAVAAVALMGWGGVSMTIIFYLVLTWFVKA